MNLPTNDLDFGGDMLFVWYCWRSPTRWADAATAPIVNIARRLWGDGSVIFGQIEHALPENRGGTPIQVARELFGKAGAT